MLSAVTYWRALWNCSKPRSSAAKAARHMETHIEGNIRAWHRTQLQTHKWFRKNIFVHRHSECDISLDSLGCCSGGGWLPSGTGMSCGWDCACVLLCVLVCGPCPLAQVTRQNPVDGLEQADSRISLSVEHNAVFCSSSKKHQHKRWIT